MLVFVDADCQVELREPNDFRSFKLVAEHSPAALPRLIEALHGVASTLDVDHAWILPRWLIQENGIDRSAEWQDQLVLLLSFARSRGWIDHETGAVRAHIEWLRPAPSE